MKDLEVKMHKFFADRGQTFDDLQMCWKPAVEEFVQFCMTADEDHEKKVKAPEVMTDAEIEDWMEDMRNAVPKETTCNGCGQLIHGPPPPLADEFTTRIPREGIIYFDGKYRVTVQVQDGYEKCGEYKDEQDAREHWASAMCILNGGKHTADDAPETIRLEPVYKRIAGYKKT